MLTAYRSLFDTGARPVVSLAEDEPLTKQGLLSAAPWASVEVAGMLRIKGLERACVVFSDRAAMGGDEAIPEWIYTALTRSNALLVLVLWPDAAPAIRAVIGRLREDRLLFWSAGARSAFQACRDAVAGPDDPLRALPESDSS